MSDNEVKVTLACLPEGTLLKGGTYRIVRFIGSGGFGCTYETIQEGSTGVWQSRSSSSMTSATATPGRGR